MIVAHGKERPDIDPSAYVAPSATLCGDVKIGANCRIMPGASIVAEGGTIKIGTQCIIFENAVIRSTEKHSTSIGDFCLVGPNAHIVGCEVRDEVFIATGATVFHGATLESRSEVRVNGVVHVSSRLLVGQTVPIGWVAVGDPAEIYPPGQHESIWTIQKQLNFPLTVYGLDREKADMKMITAYLAESLSSHIGDAIVS